VAFGVPNLIRRHNMFWYWIGVLLAGIGATLIIGALAFVSALIGGIVNGMIVLMCGPLIDKLVKRGGSAVGA
jgi:ABC-type amino acid transport system permease subunit